MVGGVPVRTHSGRCSVNCEEGYAIYMSRHGEVPAGERLPKNIFRRESNAFSNRTGHSPTRPSPNTTTLLSVTQYLLAEPVRDLGGPSLLEVLRTQSWGWRDIICKASVLSATRRVFGVFEMRRKLGTSGREDGLDLSRGSSKRLLHGPFALLGDEEEGTSRCWRC